MRILNIDSQILVPSFREMGHEVFCVGYSDNCDLLVTHPLNAKSMYDQVSLTGFVPDLVLLCDLSNLPYIVGIEELPCATAFYSIDTYCQIWHFGYAHAFDAVFVAQKDHVTLFPHTEIPTYWLPLCATRSTPEVKDFAVRDIPVSFVGTRNHKNNPGREALLRGFKQQHPLFTYTGPYAEVFARSRIVLNQTACSEVNLRTFEAMACGAALLMEQCAHGLEELIVPGEHTLSLYERGNWREAAMIAAKALNNSTHLAEIAECGREHVLRNHMARNRAVDMLAVLEPLVRGNVFLKRLEELEHRRSFLAMAYAMLGHDLVGMLDDAYVNYYFNLSARTQESYI